MDVGVRSYRARGLVTLGVPQNRRRKVVTLTVDNITIGCFYGAQKSWFHFLPRDSAVYYIIIYSNVLKTRCQHREANHCFQRNIKRSTENLHLSQRIPKVRPAYFIALERR
jgi:hypothetical protein